MHDIHLNAQALASIQADGEQAFPNECCGFLYGYEKEGQRYIKTAILVLNAQEGDQRRRFQISPLDYMKAERHAVQQNTQLLGVYHSHPNHPAIASEHDLKVAMPFFSYVILSVMEGQAAGLLSWRLKDELREFVPEKVHLPAPIPD